MSKEIPVNNFKLDYRLLRIVFAGLTHFQFVLFPQIVFQARVEIVSIEASEIKQFPKGFAKLGVFPSINYRVYTAVGHRR